MSVLSCQYYFNLLLLKYKKRLKNGEHITTSIKFWNPGNLGSALGLCDIIDLHINSHGELEAYVLDTYDFNKNSKNKGTNLINIL